MSARNTPAAKAERRAARGERKKAFRDEYATTRRRIERRRRCYAKLQAAMGRRPRRSLPARFVVDASGVVEDTHAGAGAVVIHMPERSSDSGGITVTGLPA